MRLTWPEKVHSRAPSDQIISRMRHDYVLTYKSVKHFINVVPTDVRLSLILDTPFGMTSPFMIIAGHQLINTREKQSRTTAVGTIDCY